MLQALKLRVKEALQQAALSPQVQSGYPPPVIEPLSIGTSPSPIPNSEYEVSGYIFKFVNHRQHYFDGK